MLAAHPHRDVWRIAGPALIANSTGPMVAIVDTWAIGHLPDPVLLGAIALAGFVFSYIYWAFGFLRMSTTGLVAQAFGSADHVRMDVVTLRSVLLGIAIGLAVLILQLPITRLAFAVFAPGEELAGHVQQYIDIRIWAVPVVLVRVAIIGFLIGTQRARTALLLELILNLTNAALNLLFVVVLGWGVAGVAAGSLIAEWLAGLAAIAILLRLRGQPLLQHLKDRLFWRLAAFKHLLAVNTYLFIRTLFLLGAFAFIYRTSTQLGEVTLAANHVLLTFTTLISLGLDAMAYAAEAHVGNAIGKQSRERLRQFVRITFFWALLMSVGYALIFGFAGNQIIAVLTDQLPVRAAAAEQLLLFALLPVIAVWSYQLDGIFIGATKSADMMWTMLIAFAVFIPMLYWLTADYGNHGLWIAFLVFFAVRGIGLFSRYPLMVNKVFSRNQG